jgi:lysine/ornithine N-monooxygenase
MRVICVTHENFHGIERDKNLPHPEIGETVTVIGEGVFAGFVDCYMFQEYKSPDPNIEWGFDKRNFSPLTDLDETALVTEEFEEKYFVPVNR